MDSKIIYTDLIKMLGNIKSEKDLSPEIASTLLMAYVDAATKSLMKEQKQMDRTEALLVTRMNFLQIFDEFIFNDRIDKN